MDDTVLTVEHLVVEFPGLRGTVHAVSDVSFELRRGETLGLVGESGCGKSTVARAIMQIPKPTSGRVVFEGRDLTTLDRSELRRTRPRLQMIYQDPISSLNPRRKVRDIVAEGLAIWNRGDGRAEIVADVMHDVGLDADEIGDRRPHEFQAQILNLLEQMKERYDLTLLFIAHDLAVVKNVSDRVAVMYLGKLCELGPSNDVYARPAHPYTRALMAAVPVPDPDVPLGDEVLHGDLPSPVSPPSGCRFRTRCAIATERCAVEEPVLRDVAPGHEVACHLA